MYSKRPRTSAKQKPKDLSDLDDRQAHFLRWIGSLIPALLKAVARGSPSARWILGRRRLKDGRDVELSLVANAPKKDPPSLYTNYGGGISDSTEQNKDKVTGKEATKPQSRVRNTGA